MKENKLIEQENKFIDVFIDFENRMNQLKEDFESIISNFTDKKEIPKERECFWCDKCNKRLKADEPFVKFEIWRNAFDYRNELIADTFKVYHTKCWNALKK